MLSYCTTNMFEQNKERSGSHSPGTSDNFVALAAALEAPRTPTVLVINVGPVAPSVPSYICNVGEAGLNNPTLIPSPDPAALIGAGLSASRPLIGGEAEQQAAGWTVRPPTEATWNNNRGLAAFCRLEQSSPEHLSPGVAESLCVAGGHLLLIPRSTSGNIWL